MSYSNIVPSGVAGGSYRTIQTRRAPLKLTQSQVLRVSDTISAPTGVERFSARDSALYFAARSVR